MSVPVVQQDGAAGDPEPFDGPWQAVLLNAQPGTKNQLEGVGRIPVHLKVIHRVDLDASYQLVVQVKTPDSKVIVAESKGRRYEAQKGETREDTFSVEPAIDPGEYLAYVELRQFIPVADRNGNIISDYMGMGNEVYFATVR
jgi:hypothetical protein